MQWWTTTLAITVLVANALTELRVRRPQAVVGCAPGHAIMGTVLFTVRPPLHCRTDLLGVIEPDSPDGFRMLRVGWVKSAVVHEDLGWGVGFRGAAGNLLNWLMSSCHRID